MSEFAQSSQAGAERRFFFRVDRTGEITSTVTGADCSEKLKRPFSASVVKSKTVYTPRIDSKRPTSASVVRSETLQYRAELHSSGNAHQITPRFKVYIQDDELEGPPTDYTKDFRRFAYKDFALAEYQAGSTINPEILLRWVMKAKPRNQDDVYPILQICKGILKNLMEAKLNCRLEQENLMIHEAAELQRKLDNSLDMEAKFRDEAKALRDKLEAARAETKELQIRVSTLNEVVLSKDAEIVEALAKVQDANKKAIELSKHISDIEKKLKTANFLADQRLKDYSRVNNSLTVRMQMTVKDVIFSWNLNERYQCLQLLLQENRPTVEMLQPTDFQNCSVEVRRDLTKKLLAALKVSATSWLMAVSELFGCQPSNFLDKVASWYECENLVTDQVKYHQQVEQFRGAIEGTDYSPLYTILKQGIILGRITLSDLIFNCAGATAEETMQSMTGMTLEELSTYKQRRKEIHTFLQTRDSVAAREKEDHARMRNLGFLHHGVGSADPMEPGPMCALIARIFSRKIAKDLEHGDSGKKRLNIMKVTKALLLETYSRSADCKMQTSKLVHGVRAHRARWPRVRVFGILAGMDPDRPWFERASAFVMEFVAGVVEGIFNDASILADFRRRNNLPPMSLLPPGTDRIAWTLCDHDVKVPLIVLLRAAMNACEIHPCGYGYPRDRIQEIVDLSSRPPADYVEAQRVKIRESKERMEEMNQQVTFERLYRPKEVRQVIEPTQQSISPPPDQATVLADVGSLSDLSTVSVPSTAASVKSVTAAKRGAKTAVARQRRSSIVSIVEVIASTRHQTAALI